ncbi:hypothetical protein HDE_03895 [Halotydeus destructor]|nr:hypothetical protein HDE_03895 [Halotydeus destructor]
MQLLAALLAISRATAINSTTESWTTSGQPLTSPPPGLVSVTVPSGTTSGPLVTTSGPPVTTVTPEEACARRNSSCGDCVQSRSCFYCVKNGKCLYYPFSKLQPVPETCGSLEDMRYLTCDVGLKTIWIVMASAVGVVLLLLTICCCWCCRSRASRARMNEWVKWDKDRATRDAARENKRRERQERMDIVRQRYGIADRNSEVRYVKYT